MIEHIFDFLIKHEDQIITAWAVIAAVSFGYMIRGTTKEEEPVERMFWAMTVSFCWPLVVLVVFALGLIVVPIAYVASWLEENQK